ncbi:MAG TPA: hypothetical protein VLH38_05480 [Patescibacteria group bacterium]|nr:hypothetical protein [Patescibacteria group bacterium]
MAENTEDFEVQEESQENTRAHHRPEYAASKHDRQPAAISLDDEKTERAVDDIMAHESDEILQVQDSAAERGMEPQKRGFWGSTGHFFGFFFKTSKGRWLTFFLLALTSAMMALVPTVRYWVLNTAGVRATASVVVVDELTQLPLKNVQVIIEGLSQQTVSNGSANFAKLRLGKTKLSVIQPGFAGFEQQITIGWGSNPQNAISLRATGARYVIQVRDYVSDKPVAGVLATSGDATALSDQSGKITLTLEHASDSSTPIALSKDGYRVEKVTLKPTNQTTTVALVLARKTVFINKASGKSDVYKSDIDGANRELLLAGTGNESGISSLVASQDGTHAALVSTRDNQHDTNGQPLSTLTLLDIGNSTAVSLGHANQIQLLDWIGSRLIFEQISTDTSTSTNRYSIISYDYASNSRVQLVAAPKLSAVFSAQGIIYYAIAKNENNGSQQAGFYKINPDGNGGQTAYNQEVLSGLRTDYNTLSLQTADGWISYDIKGGGHSIIGGPSSPTNRLYVGRADDMHGLWVNQGVLLDYDVAAAKDVPVQNQSGLNYPLRWLTDTVVVYRAITNNETADYITALAGGTPHKIADVVNTNGFTSAQ